MLAASSVKARLMLASSDAGQEQQEKSYLQTNAQCSASLTVAPALENVSLLASAASLFIDDLSITAKKKSFDGGVATSPPRPLLLLRTTLTFRRSRGPAKSHAVCPLQRELRSGQVINTPNLLLCRKCQSVSDFICSKSKYEGEPDFKSHNIFNK